MEEWEKTWERKFSASPSASDPWDSTSNVPNVIDETIMIKVDSIEEILATILTALPTPNGDGAIQVQTSDSDTSWPVWSVDSNRQPCYPSSVQSIQTLADSLEQAASITWQDKAVGTDMVSITWQDKAVGTEHIRLPHIDILHHLLNVGAVPVAECLQNAAAEHLPKASAVAEHLQSAVAEHWHLMKDRVVNMRIRTVLAVALISAVFYCLCTYTLQEDRAVLVYY